ncbi:DNA hydrolase [Streptomyces albus]|uniref:DNA hydrolase n=1 Tax=Streptomyces albus (strain ATCC 21838 / DSM 41398 / FERM P-419 / JCM 4703 / NBRC 107858) TaxID=1081613 RepID=A0A0B5F4H1_STRA4|nr:DNA hydrolase [Streptomyces albus]AOU80793.1 DNA hydrolase [Streptomyces albus]AYN36499.1 NUDIX hydrolase [Streptomyces albus]
MSPAGTGRVRAARREGHDDRPEKPDDKPEGHDKPGKHEKPEEHDKPEGYDKYAFEPFAVAVDLAVFTVREGLLQVLLVERGQEPWAGHRALPGGFVLPAESAESAARRELAEETGLAGPLADAVHLEQLATYSAPDRDPRMRVVSVAYTALVPDLPEPRGGGDAARADWVAPAAAGPLAFDHAEILADARLRIGAKLEYTCLATEFCPPRFTLGELQQVYETVWDTRLDRPNFRRKVLATPGFVEPVPGAARLTGGRGKPAALYRAGPATALHPPLLRPEGRP